MTTSSIFTLANRLATLKDLAGDKGIFVDGDWIESKDQDPAGDVRLIQMMDIGDGDYLNKSNRFLTSQKAKDLRCTLLRAGDVLISRMPDPLGRACIFPGDEKPCVTAVDVCIVRPDPQIADARWVKYRVNTPNFRSSISQWATGTTRERISRGNLAKIEFFLPPLPEQRRIADILDKAEAIRRKRQDAIGQTYDLRRVLLLEFTGDAASAHVRSELHNTSTYLPKGFRWRRLDEICDAICDIDHNMPKAVEKGVPFISPKDMPDNEELCFDEVKYISKEDFDRLSRKIKPRRNDIIYSRIGARLGKARLVRVDFDFLASYSCCTIRVKQNEVHPEYVTYYLDSVITRRQANLDTQSIAVPDLGLAKIKAFLVPVPSMEKQLQFVAQINVINSQISKMKSAVSDADNLFNSLVQRAFRGEL
jgi:type I restriction enzyme S subunit